MPRRADPDLPRKLVDAALAMLDTRGNATFSMRDVAKEVGYTVTAVYRAFTNREALMAAVRTRLATALGFHLVPPSDLDAHAQIAEFGRRYLRWAQHFPARYRLLFLSGDVPTGVSNAARRMISAAISRGVEGGRLQPIDEMATATFFVAALQGLASSSLSGALSEDLLGLYERQHQSWLSRLVPSI
ncbi:MAG: AcrR family transcriptional regulator [Myxococcota bacterium]|jgi:AcrR family transcriptional regulator